MPVSTRSEAPRRADMRSPQPRYNPRKDETMPVFTKAQIERFTQDGYAVLPDFWNGDEVSALQAEIERFKREGLLRNVATVGDGKTHSERVANLQLCPMSPHSELFTALPF